MIPTGTEILILDTSEHMPSMTYRMSEEKKEVRGALDGMEAIKQAVYKILQTERYKYVIYDWNYGVELEDLFGKAVSFVIPELQRRITEALLTDDRIEAVTDFSFETEKGSVTATFRVQTIWGDLEAERKIGRAHV